MVNYPHKVAPKNTVSTQRKHPIDFANRGMTFEKMINETNDYYLSHDLAVIHKKPTSNSNRESGLSTTQSCKDC